MKIHIVRTLYICSSTYITLTFIISWRSRYHYTYYHLPFGKRLHNYGKSPVFMSKFIVSMVFSIATVGQMVTIYHHLFIEKSAVES